MMHVTESRENVRDSALRWHFRNFLFGLGEQPSGIKAQQTAPSVS